MRRNLSWCLVRHISQKKNLIKQYSPIIKYNRCKHTKENIENPLHNPLQIDYREVKSYKQFLNESKTGPDAAISGLIKTLDVTQENATEAVKNWKIFSTLSTTTIKHNDSLLRDAGADKSTLRKHMFVLADTTPNLKKKIKAIQSIDLEINSAISFFQLPVTTLTEFAFITECDRKILDNYANRISYLSIKLKCDIYKLCIALCRSSFMLKISIAKLLKITEYLIDIGMSGEHIINDLIIYRYSMEKIKERMDWGLRAGIHPLKPWIVRCPAQLLEKTETRFIARKNIFKSAKTLTEYISRELNCDIESAEALIARDPTIESINIEYLSKMLKLLHDYGYTIDDIYLSPKILHSQYESIERKYETWMKYSVHKPPLSTLDSSEYIFEKRLKSMRDL